MKLLLLFTAVYTFSLVSADESPPPVATFSIVAVDRLTGEIGVAVQSKIVSVGSIVPYARAGVGAIATQALANPKFGPLGLLLLESGASPELCIEFFKKGDPGMESRQVGIVAMDGSAATFTGKDCGDWAGGISGKDFVIQGNILAGKDVVTAMAETFEATEGVLAERMIAALEAGQQAGGDRRGRQSAAILIARKNWGYGGMNDRFRDLRVEEHETPIAELKRVYLAHRKLFPRPQ